MTCHAPQPIEMPRKGEGGSDELYPSAEGEGRWGESVPLSPAPAPVHGAAFLGPPTPLPRGPPAPLGGKKIHPKSLEPEGGFLAPSGRGAFNSSFFSVSPQAPVPSPAPTPYSQRRVQVPLRRRRLPRVRLTAATTTGGE